MQLLITYFVIFWWLVLKSLENLIKNVEKFLEKRDWSQKDLATKSGIPESHLSVYLSGLRTPRLEKIEKLAEALGITPSELIKDPEVIRLEQEAFKKAAIEWVDKALASWKSEELIARFAEALKNKK